MLPILAFPLSPMASLYFWYSNLKSAASAFGADVRYQILDASKDWNLESGIWNLFFILICPLACGVGVLLAIVFIFHN